MNPQQQTQLRDTLALLQKQRGTDALDVLGAVAGISRKRMRDLAAGTGAPATLTEYSTIMMLR